MITRVLRKKAYAALPAVAALILLGFAAPSTASASTTPYYGWQTAYDYNPSALWTLGNQGTLNLGLSMAAGTTPAITAQSTSALLGDTQTAFQDSNGQLWTTGYVGGSGVAQDPTDLGITMMAGTSPSIAPMAGGTGYMIAFQGSDGKLWVYSSSSGARDLQLTMNTQSSPSITLLPNELFEIAFESNANTLWVTSLTANLTGGEGTGVAVPVGMWPGTSPSITTLTSGSTEIAFEADTGNMWTYGDDGAVDSDLGMYEGTSPSIAAVSGNNYVVAMESNGGQLWTHGAAFSTNLGVNMYPGTSPAITGLGNGGYEIAVDSSAATLRMYGTDYSFDTGQNILAGASPSIAAVYLPEG